MDTARSGSVLHTGIFGGTFDPPHNGHLFNCRTLMNEFGLAKILFVPARRPVHKPDQETASAEDRCAMVQLLVKDDPSFQVSRVEIDREEPSYTITTVRALTENFTRPGYALIIGSDSFNELDTWREYRVLVAKIPFIVMMRPGSLALREDILKLCVQVHASGNQPVEVSATEIRRRIKKGLPVKGMLPDDVLNYIENKRLYRN